MLNNYKTTLAGLLAAGLNLWANGHSLKQLLFSASVVALGAIARDWNVSSEASGARGGV